ncbi:MAG TPA: hypothetical protein VHP11_12125, partial [Tepidisphaeraceae bacterium]|nr:hypothetical protein [Tepidisphaeraceae bacterium]
SPDALRRLQAKAQQVAKTMPDDNSLQQTQQLLAAMPRSCLTPAIHEDQRQAEQAIAKKIESAEANQTKQKKAKNQPKAK